jgi:hypothetical protein
LPVIPVDEPGGRHYSSCVLVTGIFVFQSRQDISADLDAVQRLVELSVESAGRNAETESGEHLTP